MKDHLKQKLTDIFDERVSFVSATKTQGGQTGAPRGGKTVPDAVVKPREAAEVVALVQFCSEYGVPLVPRGAATSGYGGAAPVRGGIVVDFTLMNRVLSVQPEELLAVVQPGITWQALDQALHTHDLALRAYPNSGAISTVGGWIAAGGVGIGSYQYGPADRNVRWVEVVLPEGKIVRLSRDNLDLVVGAQGISGLIVAIALPVRPLQAQDVALVATYRRLPDFLRTLVAAHQQKLPLWHVALISKALDAEVEPSAVSLSSGERVEFPLTRHTALFGFPALKHPNVALELRTQILYHTGIIKVMRRHEMFWADRWQPAGLGLLGPSAATGAVMLPIIELDALYRAARAQRLPMRLVCTFSDGGWVAVRCLPSTGRAIPDDLSRRWLALATQQGARPFGPDSAAKGQGREFLGPDLYDWLQKFKQRQDPRQIMNPGKLLAK